ncbi:TetR/AcrR family transcriptional regulator [Actinospica sp.]|jgi:AcrR family transcriptional regulator|uniref:TetR/AcrR family transcriptional regulator n=1 Tax=Actinospica sp. TaxID=1872142 RepID=UPI002BC861E8|nr:TetR family transcriptional regulator [Actinospica sp.]HWG22886.1 TetR family transcriptional regulator [Actinospica sp.]
MGNREALLEGAKRCLLEKGYAKTTARDIADSAGVSLAAIGYHYGSKESLLEQAFMASMEEWFADDEADRHEESAAGSLERFQAFFDEVLSTFPQQEALLRLNMEMGLEGMRNPSLGAFMSQALQEGRQGLAEALAGLDPEKDGELAQRVGSFYSVLMTGLVAQYLIDRERFPSASDLTEGLRYVVESARKG